MDPAAPTALMVTYASSAEAFAARLIKDGKTVPAGEWSRPSGESIRAYAEEHGWDALGNWFLGRNQDADDETEARYEFPFSNDFEKVHRRGLIAIRERAAEYKHDEIFEAAGRLLDLYDVDQGAEVSPDDALAVCFFAGSPMSKFGTHGSTGFKGNYAKAWRIHFSQVGGGKITPKAGGPIRGTVRRVAMIAAAMKPPCKVTSSENMEPRGGGASPLPGTFPSSPSDYGLNKWATPGDDGLKQEDIRLTCQDLNVIKRAAIEEIKWRAAQREKEAASAKLQKISFQRRALRKRGGYEVDQKTGEMSDVSLIQMGEAKGHGMWIDGKSLDSALEILSGVSLPAYVTHEGALDSDRLLSEVGVFSGFYVDEGKLKAEHFKVLRSFREDEAERFRRLFDLAEAMPDAFGLSLVFESALVWVQEDGTEVPIEEGTPDGSLRDLPSVRFISIRSADFVDTPAANEGGLFSKPTNTKGETQMEEEKETDTAVEEVAPAATEEAAEDPKEEEASAEDTLEETTDESEATEEVDLAAEVAALKEVVAEQAAQIDKLLASLSESEAKADQLGALIEGVDALEEGTGEPGEKSLIEKFSSASGAEQTHIWKQNKKEILRAARRT